MMRVKCSWVTCKHNSSRIAAVPGTCKADEISLEPVEYGDEENSEEFFEALECQSFEWRRVLGLGQPPVIAD